MNWFRERDAVKVGEEEEESVKVFGATSGWHGT
jgi:hypothetical protein